MITKEKLKIISNDLYKFYKVFVASDYKNSKIKTPHIKRLAKELTCLHDGEFDRLCVAMPPSA